MGKNTSREDRDYVTDAMEDARDTARYFISDIMYQIQEQMEERDGDDYPDTFQVDYEFDLEKYLLEHSVYPNGDEYHHTTHVDSEYDLVEAGTLLEQLSEFEETDYGLWQGIDPRKAISAQAAYTYGNAVMSYFTELIEYLVTQLNSDPILVDMLGTEDRGTEGQIQGRIEELIDEYR